MQETIGENYENMLEEQDGADGTVSDSEYSPSNKRRKLAGRVNNNRKLRQIDVTNEDETIAAQESDNEDDLLQDQTCVPGRVCSVEMENFMCHEQLKLSFDIDHANCFFVGGANGSGKSALFAALNIGLGGKGSQNERGAALKGYIKEGTTRAKLRIVLSNTGHGAMPGYGSRIIVERVINVNGGGSYSIKTILGSGRAKREELISHKRQDLEKIMHRFGIQLANPIFWMSQDRCRQFLNVAKPEALFEIFAKATELEYTEEIYTKVEQIMCEVRSGINVLKQKSAATAEERESLMEMRKRHEGLQGKRCQLDELGWFLAWAPVKEAKQELEIVEAKKKAAEADIKQIADNILKYKHKQGEYAELKQQMHEKNEERQREVVRVRAEQTEKISGKRGYKQQLIDLRTKKKEVRNDIRVREMNLERAKNNLVKYRDNAMQDERKRRYQQAKYKIEASKESIETLRAQRTQKKEERVQAQQEHEEVKAEYSRLQQDKSEAIRRIGDINDYKKRVERMSRDELGRFGEHTKSILELIRSNANRFEKVPVGPIGMHVHVRDDQWAYAIEKATHDCLPAYVVDNQRDDKVFKQLIHQFLPNAPVSTIVTKFLPRHDISRFAPEQRFLTIERMVKIDNDVAFNLLVDKCSIESAMLMDSDEDARRVMDGNCPQNIRQCYTLSGAKAQGRNSSGGFYRFFPDNSGGTSALYLKTSKKVDANRYDQELAQLSARIPQWEDTIITVRRQVSITEGHMREAEAELRRIEERIRENEETIRQNQGIVETYDPEEDGDDPEENLKKAIETIERGIGERREVFQQIEDQENVLDAELEEANESLKELQARLDEMEDELRPFSERQQANEEKWRKLMVQIQTLEKKEQYLQETLAELDEQRVQQSRLYDNAHQLAEETSMELETPEGQTVPPDLDTLPDPRRVDRKYKLLENEINAVEKEMLSLEEVTERLARNDVVQKADVEVQQRLFKVSMALERALLVRKQKFPVMRHVITMRLKDTFSKFMTLRGMRGTVNVDFDRRVLEIPVKPKNQDRVIQDHKGLSGGERSYLTACFVMALWEIMESPFRCMDEFDVFMDSCNRKVIMDLIIQFATKTCQHSQFILFTPQGISELKVNPRVKIFEMKKVHSTS